MHKVITIPEIRVEIVKSYWLDGHSSPELYCLYLKGELYRTFNDCEELYDCINLFIRNEIGVF